jgi:hypothetical protein
VKVLHWRGVGEPLGKILGGDAQIGSGDVVTVSVNRRDSGLMLCPES